MVLGDNGQVVKQGTYSQVQDKIDEAFQSNDNQLTQVDKEAETNNIVDIPVEPPTPTPDTPAATKDRQRKSTELSGTTSIIFRRSVGHELLFCFFFVVRSWDECIPM